MIERILNIFRRWAASAERDRLSSKFEVLEVRMDSLEISQVEIKSQIKSMHEIWLANTELIEGKLNLSKANQEVIKDLIDTRFTVMNQSFEDVKRLIEKAK